MQQIKDERLQLKNLKNIRIAFIVQTIGIIAILAYDATTKGISGMTDNPLWFVLILTGVVYQYLSMTISVEHEKNDKNPTKGFIISFIVLVFASVILGILVGISKEATWVTGVVIGGILFICGIVPIIYIYYLRKNNKKIIMMSRIIASYRNDL